MILKPMKHKSKLVVLQPGQSSGNQTNSGGNPSKYKSWQLTGSTFDLINKQTKATKRSI